MSAGFVLIITRRCAVRGVAFEPGASLTLTASEARQLLDTGRAELQDEADEAALQQELWAVLASCVSSSSVGSVAGLSLVGATAQQSAVHHPTRQKNPIGFIWPTNDCDNVPQS